LGAHFVVVSVGVVDEVGAEASKAVKVSIEAPPAYPVAPRLRDDGLPEAAEKRADHHDGTSEASRALPESVGIEIVEVHPVGAERADTLLVRGDSDTHFPKEIDKVIDVEDVGDIVQGNLVRREERGAEELEGFVLGALRGDVSLQGVSSFDDKCTHYRFFDVCSGYKDRNYRYFCRVENA
jgi:hypothetical protein